MPSVAENPAGVKGRRKTPDVLGGPEAAVVDMVQLVAGQSLTVELNYDGYDDLPEEDRAAVIDRTAAIKARKRGAEEGMLAIGQMLSEVKERLPYGQFGKWVDQEFGWSQDTAERLMRIHVVFGNSQIPRIAESGASVLAMLAAPSVPEEARQEFKTRAQAGPVGVREARSIVDRHRSAPKVGRTNAPAAPVWKPQPQPELEPETELATPLQQAVLDWAHTLPAGQRIFALKDVAAHRANSLYWSKAQRASAVIGRASSGQIADAAHWARLQIVDGGAVVAPQPVAIEAEAEMKTPVAPRDLTPGEVCKAIIDAWTLPADTKNADLLDMILGPARRVQAGPGKLVVWHTADGRRVVRLNDGTTNPPWLELNAEQAAWLVKELTDGN